jgi:2-hydroxy-6-oxonona-2,4-dienedioate hydrolase
VGAPATGGRPVSTALSAAGPLERPAEIPRGTDVVADDVTFHVVDVGTGTPTIFLHGGGPGSTGWSDFGQVAPMFAMDRRCLLVDILQYGRSSKCHITGPMWEFHADRIAALMRALGIDRADFVCNSWGGSIGLCFAARFPDRVGSMVITGSMPVLHGPGWPLPESGRRGRNARNQYYGGEGPSREKMRALMTRMEWYEGARIPEATLDMRYQQSLDPGEMELAASSDHLRGEQQDLSHDLALITAPVLFFWGMYDAFLTPDYALMLAGMVDRGNLHVMDHVSHHPQEERPAEFHTIVRAFLNGGGS